MEGLKFGMETYRDLQIWRMQIYAQEVGCISDMLMCLFLALKGFWVCWFVSRLQIACRRLHLSCFFSYSDFEFSNTRPDGKSWTMNLYYMWLEYMLPITISNQFWTVDPLWIQLIHNKKVEDILTLVPHDKDLVFIPMLHELSVVL